MKAIYKYIPFVMIGLIGLNGQAQQRKDSLINRQVLIEREYAPSIKDASKLNITPSIYEPVIKKNDAKLITDAPQINLSVNQLSSIPPGDLDTGINHDNKRGYLTLGGGTHGNLEGAAGYQVIDGIKNRLDIFGYHSSTSGNINYLQDQYSRTEAKAKFADTKINLAYKHQFSKADFHLGTSYNNQSFNYYGNSFDDLAYDFDAKQNVSNFNFTLGLDGKIDPEAIINYKGSLSYNSYKTKYAIALDEKGPRGGIFNMTVDLFKNIGFDKSAGATISLLNQTADIDVMHVAGVYSNYTNFTLAPFFKIEGFSWNLNLGFNAHIIADFTENFAVTPNINFDIKTGEKDIFYTDFTGSINNNTALDILKENRYVNMLNKVEYSRTAYELKAGYRTGSIDGFEFDFFAGYKSVKKDHLYIFENVWTRQINSINTAGQTTSWGNTSRPIYADVSTGQVGALVKTKLIPYTNLSGKVTALFNSVKYVFTDINIYKPLDESFPKKAWGRPSFTIDLNADVSPIDNLTLFVDYTLAGGRKTYFNNEVISMNAINELNVKGEYKFKDWVSFFARANNLLFQKYELQYGYPIQGFNFLIGVDFKF